MTQPLDDTEMDDADEEDPDTTNLISFNRKLKKQGNSLSASRRIAAEIEETGNQVLSNLASQREIMVRSIDRTNRTSADISRSRRTLSNMSRHEMLTQVIIVLLIIGLLIAIGFVIWSNFIK